MLELFSSVLQMSKIDSNTQSTIKSQNYNLKIVPMCSSQKIIHFQKKNHLNTRSYVKVTSVWSSKNEDCPSDLMKKSGFLENLDYLRKK